MRYGVIDVGSNSVRLMISDQGQTLFKLVKTTRLAENMGQENLLKEQPVARTISAVSFFVNESKKFNVDRLFGFATAAVRRAVNGRTFVHRVKECCGLELDVVSGDTEAQIGILGALNGKDGGIVDIGGASTEIIVNNGGKTTYSKSVDIGAVKIKDACGQDRDSVQEYIDKKISEFDFSLNSEFYAIGGTATTLAAIKQELEPYDPLKVDGFKLFINDLEEICDRLFSMTIEQRKCLKGLQTERAEVIAGGALLLYTLMKKMNLNYIIISEKDNLEGYLTLKMEKI